MDVNLSMQKKIYFNARTLYLANEITPEIEDYLHRQETIFIDELNGHAVRTMIHEMQQDRFLQGVLLYKDTEAAINAFKKELTTIEAAGGFVHTPEEELLLIFRRGKWDLPKGKRDEGEDLPACAVREVAEETGIAGIVLGEPLIITYHTYFQDGEHILKESHWYLMEAPRQDMQPQEEEDIEKCIWAPFHEVGPYMDHTHGSIRDVVRMGLKKAANGL